MTLKEWPHDSEAKVFGGWVRNRLCAILRMAGTAMGTPASRIGNHSLLPGGATAMWRAGYDVEIIKRWGDGNLLRPKGTFGAIGGYYLR